MRIVVVSPEPKTHRSSLSYDLTSYFKRELNVKKVIPVQLYWGMNLVAPPIGSGREALVVLDRRLLRNTGKNDSASKSLSPEEKMKYDLVSNAFQMTLNVCDEKEIPYIFYEGEVEQGLLRGLVRKLDEVRERVLYKIAQAPFEST